MLVLSACGNTSGGYDQLKAEPEAALLFPASVPLADGGYDAESTIDGPQPASFWLIAGSDSAIEEILGWYKGQLDDRGWRMLPSSFSTSEIAAHLWGKDGTHFRLGFLDTEEWYERLEGSDGFATLFEMRLERPADAGDE